MNASFHRTAPALTLSLLLALGAAVHPGTARGAENRAQPPLDTEFQPSVPDTVVPFVPSYVMVPTVESLSGYEGTLRQGLPERMYPVVVPNQTVHVEVDGGAGGSHLGIFLSLPWIIKVARLPHCEAELVVRIGDGPEQKSKLVFTPGPMLFTRSAPPVPLSNFGLSVVPLPPGRHRVSLKLRETPAPYAFLMVGLPRSAPAPAAAPGSRD